MKPLDLIGRIVTANALHTQTEPAHMIVLEKGADYLLTVKDNQPALWANIDQLNPQSWLICIRLAWDIKTGLHLL